MTRYCTLRGREIPHARWLEVYGMLAGGPEPKPGTEHTATAHAYLHCPGRMPWNAAYEVLRDPDDVARAEATLRMSADARGGDFVDALIGDPRACTLCLGGLI